jgi:efflux transporter, outer membrane factor (OMF) lipoprotein, NodT family
MSAPGRAAHSPIRPALLVTLTSLALTACAVGPQWKPPAAPAQKQYTAHALPLKTASAPGADGAAQQFVRGMRIDAEWYRVFGSPALDREIQAALQASPTRAIAQAHLQAARAAVREAAGGRYPKLGLGAQFGRNRTSGAQFGISDPAFVNDFTLYQVQLAASYDLDPFGAIARGIESREAEAQVARARLLASELSLTDNVVASALAEAGARAALQATGHIIATQARTLKLIRAQQHYGSARRSDVLRAKAQLADSRAREPALRQQMAVARHRLRLLTAGTGDARAAFALTDFHLPTRLPLSLPSRLVRQRPDVLAAAAVMHAALAKVGVADARLLPDITLSAGYGRTGLHAGDLLDPTAAIWNLGAGLVAPLFEGGSRHAAKQRAEAEYRAAAAAYRQTVLRAFDEVADSLRALQNDASALTQRAEARADAEQAAGLEQARFKAGSADLVSLYLAQQQQQQAEVAWVRARQQRLLDTATLFRALGGGWWNAAAQTAQPSSASTPSTSKDPA